MNLKKTLHNHLQHSITTALMGTAYLIRRVASIDSTEQMAAQPVKIEPVTTTTKNSTATAPERQRREILCD